jgi:fermentation-respiration switch protein FrsA (DUF1100 family)
LPPRLKAGHIVRVRRRGWIYLCAAVGAVPLAAWAAGEVLVAPARRPVGAPPPALGAEEITFGARDRLHGWWLPGRAGAGAVVLLHGVRSDRRSMIERAAWLRAQGYGVLLFDFSAHGESEGDAISFGLRESDDVADAVAELRRRAPGERIGAIGVSMGGAAMVLAAGSIPRLDAVVLESVYATLQQAIDNRLRLRLGPLALLAAPLLEAQLSPRFGADLERWSVVERIGQLGAPLLLIGGTADRHATLDEARALFERASEPKRLWEIAGAAHIDLHRFGRDEYQREVGGFLARHLRINDRP